MEDSFLVDASMASEDVFIKNFDGTRVDELHAVHANEPNGMCTRGERRITGEHTIRVLYIFIHGVHGGLYIHVYLAVLNRNFEHCTAR